jgi:hypothetical protein
MWGMPAINADGGRSIAVGWAVRAATEATARLASTTPTTR